MKKWFTRIKMSSHPEENHFSDSQVSLCTEKEACTEVFKSHWQQVTCVVDKPLTHSISISSDDVDLVMHHLQQMSVLLVKEKSDSCAQGRILEFLLAENMLEKIRQWSLLCQEHSDHLKVELLKLFELIITQSSQPLLVHKPVIIPMLSLLNSCAESDLIEIQERMIFLLHQLCVCMTVDPQLLELFFTASSDHGPTKFLIFSLLILYVHHEGLVGQQARDALLLIMALSSKNETIGQYIAEKSDFCPVLATGLSGLYSSLPRKLNFPTDDYYRLMRDDWCKIPDMVMFLNSLEFCDAVLQVTHPLIRSQLLVYIYNGFLVPVLGPALHQNSLEEVIAATAYLDLFLRRITEPVLTSVFLKFVLTDKYDEIVILDSLVTRISSSSSKLCIVSLSLFKTMVDMHCEEVMFQLVFRYLIPCNHVMTSQRRSLADQDIYARAAQKLLSLIPTCCGVDGVSESNERSRDDSATPRDLTDLSETRCFNYMHDAHARVLQCTLACTIWSAPYDGKRPAPDSLIAVPLAHLNSLEEQSSENDTSANTTSGVCLASHGQCEQTQPSNVNFITDDSCHSEKPAYDPVQVLFHTLNRVSTPTEQTDVSLDESLCEIEEILESLDYKEEDFGISSMFESGDSQKSRNDVILIQRSRSSTESNKNDFYDDVKSTESKPRTMSLDSHSTSSELRSSSADLRTTSVDQRTSELRTTSREMRSNNHLPTVGPFLTALLHRLDGLIHNSLYVNLLLTDLLAQLASYPQVLLRSYLLNSTLIFQPNVKSLIQVLGSVKNKVDCFSYTVDHFEVLVTRARQQLQAKHDEKRMQRSRSESLNFPKSSPTAIFNSKSMSPVRQEEKKGARIMNFFKKLHHQTSQPFITSNDPRLVRIPGGGYRFNNARQTAPVANAVEDVKETQRTTNVVYAAIVLEEFLKELAAIVHVQVVERVKAA